MRTENQNVATLDVSSLSRRAMVATLPIVDVESHSGIENSVAQPLRGWSLPDHERQHLIDLLVWFTNLNRETISGLNAPHITVIYDLLFDDVELRVSDGDTVSPAIVYRVKTTAVDVLDSTTDDGNLPILLRQQHEYLAGDVYLFTTSERDAIIGDFDKLVAEGEKNTSMTKEEIKRVLLEKLENDLGRDVRVELSPKGQIGTVRITINDKVSEFRAGDVMTNLLIVMTRATRNFGIYMGIDDLYLEIFGHDDFYLTKEQQADKELAHRRHTNMRTLRDRIRNINSKVKRETGTKHDFITKVGDKYRLNPELNRLKKSRKTQK